MKYAVIIERGPTSVSGYVPDTPVCAAAGDTVDEVVDLIREGIGMHIELAMESGDPIPAPRRTVNEALAYHDAILADDDGTGPEEAEETFVVEVEVEMPELAARVGMVGASDDYAGAALSAR